LEPFRRNGAVGQVGRGDLAGKKEGESLDPLDGNLLGRPKWNPERGHPRDSCAPDVVLWRLPIRHHCLQPLPISRLQPNRYTFPASAQIPTSAPMRGIINSDQTTSWQ
jgi:hypothetical protein